MSLNSAPAAPVPPRSPCPLGEGVAAKLLAAWLANRRQTLMPHTLNFRALAPAEVALLTDLMAAAAQADGGSAAGRQQVPLALALVNAEPAEQARYNDAVAAPQPLARLVGEAKEAGLGAHAYAGALLVVDRASPVAQALLAYLAARLALPPDLAHALESRYRV